MKHDTKCERLDTARAIAKKAQLSRREFEGIAGEGMVLGFACYCLERSMGGGFGWGREGEEQEERAVLRERTIEFVFQNRKVRRGMIDSRGGKGGGKGDEIGEEEKGGEGKVIPVDFKLRRRVDYRPDN